MGNIADIMTQWQNLGSGQQPAQQPANTTVSSYANSMPRTTDIQAAPQQTTTPRVQGSYASAMPTAQPQTQPTSTPATQPTALEQAATGTVQGDWNAYWSTSNPGDSVAWGNGTLTRNADGTATYNSPTVRGGSQIISQYGDPRSLAMAYPELMRQYNDTYGTGWQSGFSQDINGANVTDAATGLNKNQVGCGPSQIQGSTLDQAGRYDALGYSYTTDPATGQVRITSGVNGPIGGAGGYATDNGGGMPSLNGGGQTVTPPTAQPSNIGTTGPEPISGGTPQDGTGGLVNFDAETITNLIPTSTSASTSNSGSNSTSYSGLPQEVIDQILSVVLPKLTDRVNNAESDIDAEAQQSLAMYNDAAKHALENGTQGILNKLAARGVLNADIASGTFADAIKGIADAAGNKAYQAGADASAKKQALMSMYGQLAELGKTSSATSNANSSSDSMSYQENPLAGWELLWNIINGAVS